MAKLSPVQAKLTGTTFALAAANSGGDTIEVGPHQAILVKNDAGSSVTVTVVVPGNTEHGQAEPDVPVAVAAGTMKLIGPFDADLADPTDRLVHLTYSSATSVTVGAIRV